MPTPRKLGGSSWNREIARARTAIVAARDAANIINQLVRSRSELHGISTLLVEILLALSIVEKRLDNLYRIGRAAKNKPGKDARLIGGQGGGESASDTV